MKLTIAERFVLGDILSAYVGKFELLKIVRKGRELLSFTPEEAEKLNFQTQGNIVNWDPKASKEIGEVEIDVNPIVADLIKTSLNKLNDSAQLSDRHFSVYEKFVLNS